jgi:triosephosphate isomerase
LQEHTTVNRPGVVIAGNWKMHMGPAEAREFVRGLSPEVPADVPLSLLLFPPAISLVPVVETLGPGSATAVGAQSIHWEDEGAFTGEISAPMVRQAGATHALVGHSERRHVFGETDDEVRRKVEAAARHGLVPVVCVGETLAERRADRVDEVIERQLDAALEGLGDDPEVPLILAYEPVWAIGTGETATPEDAASAHATLRRRMVDLLGAERAAAVPILYGGSVKPHNAEELLAAPEVDGVLVGGASLDPESFGAIAEAGARVVDRGDAD